MLKCQITLTHFFQHSIYLAFNQLIHSDRYLIWLFNVLLNHLNERIYGNNY